MAVAGVASAQVAVSGKLGFAYQTESTAGTVSTTSNGLKVTDGNFVIAASEDLGAGLKIAASMDVQSRGRDTAIAGRDASLTLSGGFGSVMIGAIELGNGIIGLGGADAPTMGLDGASGAGGIARPVLSDVMNMDVLMYTSPDLSGFTVSAAILDATPVVSRTVDTTVASTTQSVGSTTQQTLGLGSSATTQDAVLIGLNYANGPYAAAIDYTNFGLNAVAAGAGVLDNRLRLSVSYDFGVAKVGFGYEKLKDTAATNNGETQYLFGVSAPVSANASVGVNYARNNKDGANTITAYELGAGYSLSKRTGLQAAYQHISEDTVAGSATAFRVRLLHSF